MKIALVNYASPGAWYIDGQNRMVDTMRKFGFNGDIYAFKDTLEFGSPSHSENPYAFKIYAIKHAIEKGADIVWWMDSSIFPVKNIDPILKIVEEKGYFFEECGHLASTWANDRCLKYFGITRDEAEFIPMFSAGFMILDFRKQVTKDFYAKLILACVSGIFRGNWSNQNKSESDDERCQGHRHDMVCASIIAKSLGMTYSPGGEMLSYVGEGYAPPKETSIFHLQPPH